MRRVKLSEALGINLDEVNIIAVLGGGGKTTTLRTLAMELKGLGLKVLNATSTGIYIPEFNEYDNVFIGKIPLEFVPSNGSITYFAETNDGVKLRLKNIELINEIIDRNIFDIVLMEADGSKGFPIKAPAEHEPVVSKHTNITIGIIGLDCLGSPIDENHVHRPELLRKITKSDIIDIKVIVDLARYKDGLFKNSKGKKILLLNKADDEERINAGRELKKLLSKDGLKVIIADIQSGNYDII